MLLLVPDIFPDAVYSQMVDTSSKITCLPGKMKGQQLLLIDPAGRLSFDLHYYFIKTLLCRQGNQAMDMFLVTIYEINVNAFLTSIFPNVLKYLIPDLFSEKRLAVFGCPNYMDPDLDERHNFLALIGEK